MVSRFAVTGKAGLNHIRFPRPGSKLALRSGTYRVSGWTRSGRLVEQVILVVVDKQPTASQLQRARSANVCATAIGVPPFGAAAAPDHVERALSPAERPSANGPLVGPGSLPGRVLGSTVVAARAVRPVLVALLGLAIVLLGLASLPELSFVDRRANDLLARHRLEILAFGAAALIAVVITFFAD